MIRNTALLALLLTACTPGSKAPLDGRNAERAIEHIEPGMLVITEMMINPAACPDDVGEWFEVKNLTAAWLQLEGLTITDADFYRSTMSRFELAPNASAVIGRGTAETFCSEGPEAMGYFDGDIALNNSGDAVHLYNQRTGILIDQTPIFPEEMVLAGESIMLQPAANNATANDDLNAWFVGSECPYDPQPNTPNEDNPTCDFDAPAPAIGWFGLTCQGSDCEIPATFDLAQNLGSAWNEAEEAHSWPNNVGDELYFESMSMNADGIRAEDWFTADFEPDIYYTFLIPGDGDDGDIWDHWIFIDVGYSDIQIESDSGRAETPLNREQSLARVGGISLPGAIQQLADSDPDFQIHYARVAQLSDDSDPVLEITDREADQTVRWNATTGERLQ